MNKQTETGRDALNAFLLTLSNEDLVDWLLSNDFVETIIQDNTIHGENSYEKMINFLEGSYRV